MPQTTKQCSTTSIPCNMSREHAILSASGASRWMNCTPSARLEGAIKKESTSSYAAEGTLAHAYAEHCLNEVVKGKHDYDAERAFDNNPDFSKEMKSEVMKYYEYVLETFAEAKRITKDTKLIVEQKLDFSDYVPEGFGTGDAVVITSEELYVIDLKYGKGVKVDADYNPQLMLYGLGALNEFEAVYDISKVHLCIMQPRLDHVSEWEISTDILKQWGEEVVKPKAQQAFNGEGECKPGDWCRWCKVKATCKALADENLALAKHEFAEPKTLTLDQLVEVYEQIPLLTDWADAVAKHLLDQALNGEEIKGYKVVEGRSNRKFSDEDKVKERLTEMGYKPEDFTTVKLATLTALERLIGKKDFSDKIGDLVIRPQGKPILAPESDKRPPYSSAEKDFQ